MSELMGAADAAANPFPRSAHRSESGTAAGAESSLA
jgi:hypothetical protein